MSDEKTYEVLSSLVSFDVGVSVTRVDVRSLHGYMHIHI